jgi:nucleotide sugar dehydrogenase
MVNICVVGLGKMGMPVAALFASRGHHVVGADINPAVVEAVNAGRTPVDHEPGVDEMIQASVAAGNLRATTDTAEAVRASDVVIVLVPLLVDPANNFEPAYGPLESAMRGIGAGIHAGTLVVIETTLPVGDTRKRLGPIIEQVSGLRAGTDFFLAFSPERVQSNHVIRNLREYPKVMGGINEASTAAAVRFYRECLTEKIIAVADSETAEFSKIAECVYRDVNIALANELAICADEIGVDINEVITAANSEPLSSILKPGLGVGGHCIPVYPYFMINQLQQTTLASAARIINDQMAHYAVHTLEREQGPLAGQTIVILGLSYRANVKEPTFSSALLVARALSEAGALVLVHDPLFTPSEIARLGLTPAPDLAALPPVAGVVVQAWHADFKDLDWRIFRGNPLVLDGRNVLDPIAVEAAGLRYRAVGAGNRTIVAPIS